MPSSLQIPTIDLTGEVSIPQFGLGVFQVPPEDTAEIVLQAIEMGYRHIDTAKAYRNEAGVGQAVRASGLDRSEFFITTKCFNDDHGYDSATRALKTSLDQLEMDYVDLYLIHWPVPSQDRYVETWQAIIEGQQAGLARAIGVSNFQPAHLRRIIDETGVTPAVNQIELHPYFPQAPMRAVNERLGIRTESWSPDSPFGHFLTYMLVVLPLAWLTIKGLFSDGPVLRRTPAPVTPPLPDSRVAHSSTAR